MTSDIFEMVAPTMEHDIEREMLGADIVECRIDSRSNGHWSPQWTKKWKSMYPDMLNVKTIVYKKSDRVDQFIRFKGTVYEVMDMLIKMWDSAITLPFISASIRHGGLTRIPIDIDFERLCNITGTRFHPTIKFVDMDFNIVDMSMLNPYKRNIFYIEFSNCDIKQLHMSFSLGTNRTSYIAIEKCKIEEVLYHGTTSRVFSSPKILPYNAKQFDNMHWFGTYTYP